jgi:hypothetical protein
VCSEATEGKEDAWYNLASDSEDKDNNLITPSLTFPLSPSFIATLTAFTMPNVTHKKHFTGARIKAIYMLEEKKSVTQLKAATAVSRTRVYYLAAVARERG